MTVCLRCLPYSVGGNGWLEAKVTRRLSPGAQVSPAKISCPFGGQICYGNNFTICMECADRKDSGHRGHQLPRPSPAGAEAVAPTACSWETGTLKDCWVLTLECFTSPRMGLLDGTAQLPGAERGNGQIGCLQGPFCGAYVQMQEKSWGWRESLALRALTALPESFP